MQARWMLSEWVTRIMWGGVLLIFLGAEVVVIVVSVRLPGAYSVPWIGTAFLNGFLVLIPLAGAVWGYNVIRRQRPIFEEAGQQNTFVWLSRHFLAATIFAYVAITSVVLSLAEGVRPK